MSQQERVKMVMRIERIKSVITVQINYRRLYGADPSNVKTLKELFRGFLSEDQETFTREAFL